jgi:hypothetical protein
MLDKRYYNIEALKKMSKKDFYAAYEGKMPDIDKVWEGLHKGKKSNKAE